MKVKRVIEKFVNKCPECPYYINHPHENACLKLQELGYRGYANMVPRDKIDPRCPFLVKVID